MKYRSHKIILMVTAGILLSFSFASAKNFTIFNATNANMPYFSVNGTSGNVGIGITNPATLLQILNNGWISAKNNAGTGVVNMFKVNAFDQIEVGAPLNIGSFEFSPDSGLVTFVDMPVTAAAASGTIESYVFKLDGDNMLSIYAESNGVGGIQNKRVGIGKTNPTVTLDVVGGGYFTGTVGGTGLCIGTDCRVSWNDIVAGGGGNLWAGTTTSAIYSNNGNFNVGIGTSVPLSKLQIGEQTSLSTATPITLSLGGTFSSVAGTSSKLKLYDSAGSIYGLGVSSSQFDFMIPTGARYSWNINGAEKMRLDTNGNLGIGTTVPEGKLHIQSATPDLIITDSDISSSLPMFRVRGYDGGGWATRGAIVSSQVGGVATDVMSIINGNVGINTTNSTAKLDVNGSLRVNSATISLLDPGGIVMADGSGNLYATSTAIATGLPSPIGISGQTLRSNGTNWVANSILFNDGTSVGIGTTTPAYPLDVNGSARFGDMTYFGEYLQHTGDADTYLRFLNNRVILINGAHQAFDAGSLSGQEYIALGSASDIDIKLNDDLFVEGSSSNVGIGKVNPGANLDVFSTISAGSSISALMYCLNGVCKSDWSEVTGTNFWGGATTTNIWSNNGAFNVGIGKTNPGFKLDVAGVVNATALYVGGVPYIGSQWITNGTSVYYNTGNVGIGYSAPTVALNVLGSGDFTGTVNGSGLCIAGDCKNSWDLIVAAGGGNLWSGTSTGVIWSANGTNNVGVGTSSPTAKLDVAGDLKIGDTSGVCNASKKGGMRYNATSRQTYLCDGVKWKNMNNCGIITDADGNLYGTVQIGGQCWMAENMNVGTKLASGATLPNTSDNTVEKWCYNNSDANCTTYGGLYNWLEATRGSKTAGARGICPNGWHIPTDREFNDLEQNVIATIDSAASQYVCDFNTIIPATYYWRRCADNSGTDAGGTLGAGKSLKEIGQGTGNGAGDDLVGFALKLNGARNATNNAFEVLGTYGYIWSSTLTYDVGTSQVYAWYRVLKDDYTTVDRGMDLQSYGFAVRCVRD